MSLREWSSEKKLIDRIAKSIGGGRVSHAYIIEGDRCTDKLAFAKDFLKAVACSEESGYGCDSCVSCRKIEHDNCEDLYILRAEWNQSKTAKSVKVKMIEELQANLKAKPVGSRNMAIIDDADTMTPEAQNKLLKTLEEPWGNTVILLLSENRENLLQTIRSRCISYRLSGLDNMESDLHVDMKGAETIINALLEQEKFFYLKQILSKTVKNRDDALLLLDGMERIYRNILLQKDERSRLFRNEDIFRNVSLIEEARRDLLAKVSYKYAIKNLLLKIGG